MSVYRIQNSVTSAQGIALSGVDIYLCTQPANVGVNPPTPLATIYTDATGSTPLAQPVQSDGLGNWFMYAASGVYTVVVIDPLLRIPVTVFLDQVVVAPGAGTVTSVAIQAPTEFNVNGSPILNSGTIALTKATQNANAIWAGPASGPAAQPAFRALVLADMPAGVGSVSSVGIAVTPGALFAMSTSGPENPIIDAGVITINLDFNIVAPNAVLAGPTSGGVGPVTSRSLVPADLPGQTSVPFAATQTFDASIANSFRTTLTGNVTSSTIVNPTAGQTVTFIITQDGTGGRSFVWPANVKGESAIGTDANSVSVQSFIYDGTNWRATGPGSVNAS